MAELIDLIGGDLEFKLSWMFEEGTNWTAIKEKLEACSNDTEKTALQTDAWRDKFVGELGDEEMAQLLDLLGGDLEFKLTWMFEEGTNWELIRAKVSNCNSDTEKTALRTDAWRDKFVGELGDDEMAELIDLIGGDLEFKLGWMFEEGTNWKAIKEKVEACSNDTEKAALRTDAWRDKFVGELGDEEMAELVTLIGGDLKFKISWMLEEGTNPELVNQVINATPDPPRAAEIQAIVADTAFCTKLYEELGADSRDVFKNMVGSNAFLAASLLTYDWWLDWVITDEEAVEALELIATASSTDQVITMVKTLGKWDRLISNLPTGSSLSANSKTHLRTLFDSASTNVDDEMQLFEIRFDLDVENNSAAPWDHNSLQIAWTQLDPLPDGLVADNSCLEIFTRHAATNSASYSWGSERITLPGGAAAAPGTVWWDVANNQAVVHEVGHAVDNLLTAEDWYRDSSQPIYWEEFTDGEDWMDAIIAAGGWGPVTTDEDKDKIKEIFEDYYDNLENTAGSIDPTDATHPWNVHGVACPLVYVGRQCQTAGAYWAANTMTAYSGRVYVRRDGYNRAYSFSDAAKNAPAFPSAYGLTADVDWFAEQFRRYFLNPASLGAGLPVWVKDWFDDKLFP